MRRLNHRNKRKIFLAVWLVIISVAIYLLIQLLSLLIKNNINGTQGKFSNLIMSKVCAYTFESGSPLIQYSLADKRENLSFPITVIAEGLPAQEFIADGHVYASANQPTYQPAISKSKARYHSISNEFLSKEYVLSNGSVFNNTSSDEITFTEMPVGIIGGDFYFEEEEIEDDSTVTAMRTYDGTNYTLDRLKDVNFLVSKFYIVDPGTRVIDKLFNSEELLAKDMTLKQNSDKPQILIYHTHSQEAYADSKPGAESDSVVGIGEYMATVLKDEYGYNVIHDKSVYDVIDGKLDRSKAYDYAREGIKKILKENPSIEIIIDLHRDGAAKRITDIDGDETAQIMLLNGLSRDQNGPLTHIENPYIQDNLAFSLQLQMKSHEIYPKLFYRTYLNAYRYNLDLRPRCMLVELGTHKNTLQSAKNAIPPFAEVLDKVLKGE